MRKHLGASSRAAVARLGLGLGLWAAACGNDPLVGETAGGARVPDAGATTDAAARCMLGVSPVATSTLCASDPELCGTACGDACVDVAHDADNCGACGRACAARAACNEGVCGGEPTVLVAPAPGCASIRLALDEGAIYWSDLGHGTINRVSETGGPATTLASGVIPATIHTSSAQPLFVNDGPVGTSLVVRGGTAYWIAAADRPSVDAGGLASGGAGTSIWSVRAGGAPTVVLPAELAPGPSPVSSVSTSASTPPLEAPDGKPPLTSMTLSPDGQTLYFGAGSRLYQIPSAGAKTAADVALAGYTAGPETGFATALATDGKRLFYPSSDGTGVEMYELGQTCTPSSATGPGAGARAASYTCPSFVFGSFPIPLLDTITVAGGLVTWAKENNVWRADLSTADPSIDGHAIYSDTVMGFGVTGFAVAAGGGTAYFGENELIEKGAFATVDVGNPPAARVLARGEPWPSSFLLDGARVFWTTSSCDVSTLVDPAP